MKNKCNSVIFFSQIFTSLLLAESSKDSMVNLNLDKSSFMPEMTGFQLSLIGVIAIVVVYIVSGLVKRVINKDETEAFDEEAEDSREPQSKDENELFGKIDSFHVDRMGLLTISGYICNPQTTKLNQNLKVYIGGNHKSPKASVYYVRTDVFRLDFNRRNGFVFRVKIPAQWALNQKIPVFVYGIGKDNKLIKLEDSPRFFVMSPALLDNASVLSEHEAG